MLNRRPVPLLRTNQSNFESMFEECKILAKDMNILPKF